MDTSLTSPSALTYSAFLGHRLVARGTYAELSQALAAIDPAPGPLFVFDDATSALVDAPHPSGATPAPQATAASPPPSVGRPKLGVVAREVTLLPRHWEWLSAQRGGASAALRRLVEDARRTHAGRDAQRAAQERTFRFINAVGGNLPGFEEVARTLFAGDANAFAAQTEAWPRDVRVHAAWLAREAFGADTP